MENLKNQTDLFKSIECLEFKATNSKSNFYLHSLDENIADNISKSDPDIRYSTSFTVELIANKEGGTKKENVGFIKATSFEPESVFFIYGKIRFMALCDMLSSSAYRMAEAVSDDEGFIKSKICPINSRIIYIDELYIEENYRNYGIGRYLLDNINKIISQIYNYEHYVCLLESLPMVLSERTPEHQKRLNNYYKKAGFKPIKNTGVMYRIPP